MEGAVLVGRDRHRHVDRWVGSRRVDSCKLRHGVITHYQKLRFPLRVVLQLASHHW